MEVFNFCSTESFLCYQAIIEDRRGQAKALVEKAFEQVETNEWYEMGQCVSYAAQEELAKIVEKWILQDAMFAKMFPYCESVDDAGYGRHDREGLLAEKLMLSALERIDFEVVAEALLRQQKKWAPDKVRPDFN